MSKKQNKEQKIFLRKEKQVTSRNSVLRRGAKSGQTFSSSLLSIFTNEFTKLAATDRTETNITSQMEVRAKVSFWKGVTFCFVSKSLTENLIGWANWPSLSIFLKTTSGLLPPGFSSDLRPCRPAGERTLSVWLLSLPMATPRLFKFFLFAFVIGPVAKMSLLEFLINLYIPFRPF